MWDHLRPLKPTRAPSKAHLRKSAKIWWIEQPDSTRALVVGNCSQQQKVPSSLFRNTQRVAIPRACNPTYILLYLLARDTNTPTLFTLLSCDAARSQVDLLVDSTSVTIVSELVLVMNRMAEDVASGKIVSGVCNSRCFPLFLFSIK